jgi:hypothetical protein
MNLPFSAINVDVIIIGRLAYISAYARISYVSILPESQHSLRFNIKKCTTDRKVSNLMGVTVVPSPGQAFQLLSHSNFIRSNNNFAAINENKTT